MLTHGGIPGRMRHGYGESLYDSGNTYRGNWVPSSQLTGLGSGSTTRPCHSQGPGRFTPS